MNDRRTRHLERDFVDLVEAAIERGDMTLERAADYLLENRIPQPVVARVIDRAQHGYDVPLLDPLFPTTGDPA